MKYKCKWCSKDDSAFKELQWYCITCAWEKMNRQSEILKERSETITDKK